MRVSRQGRGVRRRQIALAGLAATALVLTGCGSSVRAGADATPTQAAAPSAVGATAGTQQGTHAEPAFDPSHAVTAPGRLTSSLAGPDLLVWSRATLSSAEVARIRALPGVSQVEQLTMAQVSIQDRLLNVAAVDPATYRRFTPTTSAHLQQMWDRVAGGEVAIVPQLKTKLGISKTGYLQLGSATTAPRVHVGAFAPQIPQVDAVVDAKWGQALGMTPGNALLISTGITAPDKVRAPVAAIAGSGVSVQRLDIAARLGLDPSAVQTALLVGSIGDAVGTYNYRVLGGGRIAPDPAWVASHIVTEAVPILGDVTCNRAIFPQLRAALADVVAQGLTSKIHPSEYAGCYNPRFIAGTTTLSNHAFGLALDINAVENERGTVGQMDRGVVAIFEHWGFTWGGTWHYTDPMHFEMNSIVHPG